jgi:hypothetical protein
VLLIPEFYTVSLDSIGIVPAHRSIAGSVVMSTRVRRLMRGSTMACHDDDGDEAGNEDEMRNKWPI